MATSEPVLEVDRSDRFISDFHHNLWDMKTRGEGTDMTIIATNVPIRCHSVVMAAASEHFRELLKGPMENATAKQIELNFDEVYVQKVVEYCYTGKISIEFSSAESYLRIVEYFHLKELKFKIENFVCEHLSRETCIGWNTTARELNLFTLEKKCQNMIASDLKQMTESLQFHQLPAEEVKVCMRSCMEPDVALNACVSWATSNPLSRHKDFLGLLMHIRLDKCSPQCVERVLQTWKPMWPNYTEVQKALRPFASVVPKAPPNPPKYPAIHRQLTMLLFGGFTQTNVLNRNMWKIDLKAGTWELFGTMDHRAVKYDAGYCSTPEKLFVIGGSKALRDDKYQPLSGCHALSIRDSNCEVWPDMDEPLSEVVTVWENDHIYTFGGDSSDKAVYRLNLTTRTWSRCPDMPVGNFLPIIAVVGHTVYMIFNTLPDNDEYITSKGVVMHSLDTHTLKWTPRKKLPASIKDTCHAKAVTVGENIYLVGGRNKLCAKYSPQQKTWELLARPREDRQIFSAVHVDGDIVLCGGSDEDDSFHDTIEVYSIAKNTWKIHSVRMPQKLEWHHSVVYDENSRKIVLA